MEAISPHQNTSSNTSLVTVGTLANPLYYLEAAGIKYIRYQIVNEAKQKVPKVSFVGQKRLSDSPYVHSVWTGVNLRDGLHTSAADGNLDLVIMRRGTSARLWFSGPTTKARTFPYKAGDENTGIKLRRGVYVPDLPARKILDIDRFLPNAGKHAFWFQGSAIPFPIFDNVEVFVEKLVKLGILRRDIVVEDALASRSRGTSTRTMQRHFLGATGLTPHYMSQIQRAERALELLQQGIPVSQVVHDAGFSDQPHMTNSLKRLLGHTPGQIRRMA